MNFFFLGILTAVVLSVRYVQCMSVLAHYKSVTNNPNKSRGFLVNSHVHALRQRRGYARSNNSTRRVVAVARRSAATTRRKYHRKWAATTTTTRSTTCRCRTVRSTSPSPCGSTRVIILKRARSSPRQPSRKQAKP